MLSVLVVEPRSEIAVELGRACDSAVTTVISARDRQEAGRLMRRSGPFEVVVVSSAIGQGPALELVDEVRRRDQHSVIVCVLGELTEELEKSARLRGASLCISKSEEYQELLQVLWHVERRKAMGKSLGASWREPSVGR